MALAMSRPWKHPKTGVYWLRKRVPHDLLAVIGKPEAKRTLGTKDPEEAKRRHSAALVELEAQWANLRAGPRTLSEVEAHALVAYLYGELTEHYRDNPSEQKFWRVELIDRVLQSEKERVALFESIGRVFPEWWHSMAAMEDWCRTLAARILAEKGLVVDEPGLRRVERAIAQVAQRAALHLKRRAEGHLDAEPALGPASGPSASRVSAPVPVAEPFAFEAALKLWIAEKQPAPKTVYEWTRVLRQLEAHLGHADARRVSADDLIAWKAGLVAAGQKPKTIRDAKIAPVRAILQCAVNNRKLDVNPAERVVVDVKTRAAEARRGFTDAEAVTILRAAQRATDPVLRWVPFVCAYSGARVSEVCQLRREDIHQHEGVWCMRIAAEAGSLKNVNSERAVPLHPALISEGFLGFLDPIKTGPIFAGLPPDTFGKRGGNGTKVLGRFVRSLGLTDLRLGPNHSWRHRFKTQGRVHGLALDIVNAMTGHGTRSVADAYGEFPMSALYRELIKIPAVSLNSAAASARAVDETVHVTLAQAD